MCIAVPMQVTEIDDQKIARCRVGDSDTFVTASLALLSDTVSPGDYVLVHAGFAIEKADPQMARETLELMREMLEIAKGDRK